MDFLKASIAMAEVTVRVEVMVEFARVQTTEFLNLLPTCS